MASPISLIRRCIKNTLMGRSAEIRRKHADHATASRLLLRLPLTALARLFAIPTSHRIRVPNGCLSSSRDLDLPLRLLRRGLLRQGHRERALLDACFEPLGIDT